MNIIFRMSKAFKKVLLCLFAFISFSVFITACRKNDHIGKNENNILTEQFFKLPAKADPEIANVIKDLKSQNRLTDNLQSFIQKNGVPRWDKVHYKVDKSTSSGITGRATTDTSSGQGIFLIPLQSASTQNIKSYIACYKHNDSLYTYRLYNKDSLEHVKKQPDSLKLQLMNTLAVFSFFEKTVNGKDSILVNSPQKGYIKNANIEFAQKANNVSGRSSSFPAGGCSYSIEIVETYIFIAVFINGELAATFEYYSFIMEVQIFCDGGGGGGYGYGGGGYGSGGYGGNYWGNYGTGWPWNTGGSSSYDPGWYPFWTVGVVGSPGGSGSDPFYDPVYINGIWYSPNEFPGKTEGTHWKWWEDDVFLLPYGGINFGTWAIGYLSQNPFVDFHVFQKQFMILPEGQDGTYDANYWDDPNLTFSQQILPSWDSFSAAYPKHSDPLYDTPVEVYASIGGQVLNQYNTDPLKHQNTCALRISKALNYSGIIITAGTDRYLGADGKYYFLSAKALLSWMKITFGTPTGSNYLTSAQGGTNGQNFPDKVANKKGIYMMTPNYPGGCPTLINPLGTGFCANGHADMIEYGNPDGGWYFNARGGVHEIFIWELQ
jgi:hypothetical protein